MILPSYQSNTRVLPKSNIRPTTQKLFHTFNMLFNAISSDSPCGILFYQRRYAKFLIDMCKSWDKLIKHLSILTNAFIQNWVTPTTISKKLNSIPTSAPANRETCNQISPVNHACIAYIHDVQINASPTLQHWLLRTYKFLYNLLHFSHSIHPTRDKLLQLFQLYQRCYYLLSVCVLHDVINLVSQHQPTYNSLLTIFFHFYVNRSPGKAT